MTKCTSIISGTLKYALNIVWIWCGKILTSVYYFSVEFSFNGFNTQIFIWYENDFGDQCLGHEWSAVTIPTSKDLVTLKCLRNYFGTADTPESCQKVVEETIANIEASYNEKVVMIEEVGFMNGEIYMIFPIKSLSHIAALVLLVKVRIVLKIHQLLLEKSEQKGKIETGAVRADQEGN